MTRPPVTPLRIPRGKIVDFIDGSLRSDTPEEYVRQEIEKSLVREYNYSREDIEVEYRVKMGSTRKPADLAIFPEHAPHDQEHAWAIIECKRSDVPPHDKREGVDQLKSYMAACLNTEFGMWTNGQERLCYRKVQEQGAAEFEEVPDIPRSGESPDAVEAPRITDLRPATSDALLFAFRRCHNYIAGNQGLQKPEAFWELLKLIFCKIEDERSNKIDFYATSQERQTLNGQLKVKSRLDKIFEVVCEKYGAIFSASEKIDLEPRVLAYLVSQIQSWSLLYSDVDVKGKAYEEIVGSNLRGDRGEFFTPRNICRMTVAMLDPGPGDLILDPACGTGGFLTIAMNHVIDTIRASERAKWRDPNTPREQELLELERKVREYADKCITGIDINPNLVKASKMNMVMNNDGAGGLYQGNSLENPLTWSSTLQARSLLGNVDLLFTNPPFGAKIPVDDPVILEQFDLGHTWGYDAEADRFFMHTPPRLQKSQPPEILFIERCVQFLKPGTGRMAIVLPDGILGAPSLGYVREWILEQTRVLASIDLHPNTFEPGNSTQTSLLVLERKRFNEIELEKAAGRKRLYEVFMALANHIGHDKRGNRTFVRDAEGNELVVTRQAQMVDIQEGKPIERTVEVQEKLVDDNTAEIAVAFREWLASL